MTISAIDRVIQQAATNRPRSSMVIVTRHLSQMLSSSANGPTIAIMGRKSSRGSLPRPLPDNRQALEFLLFRADQSLRLLEPVHQRQKRRLHAVREALVEPNSILRHLAEFRESRVASQTQFAIHAVAPGPLQPYLDGPRLKSAIDCLEHHRAQLPKVESIDTCGAWVDRFEQLLAAEQEIIDLHQELQAQLIEALKTCADRADSNADKIESFPKFPKNPKVIQLASRINRDLRKGETQKSVALGLTDGDENEAKNLLRQLRRFRHLLERRLP